MIKCLFPYSPLAPALLVPRFQRQKVSHFGWAWVFTATLYLNVTIRVLLLSFFQIFLSLLQFLLQLYRKCSRCLKKNSDIKGPLLSNAQAVFLQCLFGKYSIPLAIGGSINCWTKKKISILMVSFGSISLIKVIPSTRGCVADQTKQMWFVLNIFYFCWTIKLAAWLQIVHFSSLHCFNLLHVC